MMMQKHKPLRFWISHATFAHQHQPRNGSTIKHKLCQALQFREGRETHMNEISFYMYNQTFD